VSWKLDKLTAAIAFLVSVAATSWCWWLAGPGLAFFLGEIILSALYLPPIALAQAGAARWPAPCAATIGIAVVDLLSLPWVDVSTFEWLRCTLICLTFSFAMCGTGVALTRFRLGAPVAATSTVIVALAWLTWPVWLSPWLTQGLVNWLVPAHPLLAVNGVLQHLGSWDRAPIAYRQLTILNQDIPYHLPRSIIPAVALHGAVGLLVVALPWHGLPARAKQAANEKPSM
jgi:hypothetical protein